MSEINWDLAPEDAETLEQNVNIITWRKKGYFWLGMDGWKEEFFPTEWTVVATRPTEKKKTVADAYEAFPNGWLGSANSEYNFLNYNKRNDWFFSDTAVFQDVVCSREEYEAYAKEQESKQEGERWTHTDDHGDRFKFDFKLACGERVYLREDGQRIVDGKLGYSKLKPIKPTITKAEAWDKFIHMHNNLKDNHSLHGAYKFITNNYEVID